MRRLAFSLLFAATLAVHAQTVTFTSVDQRNHFQSFWQLSNSEMQRYEQVMMQEGRFRYPRLTPLEVLAVTAPDEETMRYYARKAAADEMRAVEAQVHFAVMVTEEKTKIYEALKEKAEARHNDEANKLAEQQLLEQKIKQIIAESEALEAKEKGSK